MKDRFDLENEIVSTSSFCDHLDDIMDSLFEKDHLDRDEIISRIGAVSTLLRHHTDKMLDTMCQVLHLDEYNSI